MDKTLKLVSWNVNGIRAADKKGFKEYFESMNADVFCIQEIKLSEGQYSFEPEGYTSYFNYAEKRGYSGTALYSKLKPLNVTFGIGHELDNEGRTILAEYDNYYVLCVYTPNSKAELARIDLRMDWDKKFKDFIAELDKTKPVMVCGDLNVAHKPIDIKNAKANEGKAGYSIQERDGFDNLLSIGLIDSFRYLKPTAENRYSWWSYRFKARDRNAGWRLDYWLVSDRIKEKIVESEIDDQILGSDHAPVYLEIKL
ncbi:MAG: exodeoxyribonuclease III [Sphaerochaetaceae bacterium]|nr:exodeoxyribonuclease III [Sphaerochaetaceae bacterium]